jgi:S-adenosylhomocysteine hydrolase
MPGLMALRSEYKDEQPLAGSISILHTTIQTAVLIRDFNTLGAEVTWSSTFSLLKIKLLLLWLLLEFKFMLGKV